MPDNNLEETMSRIAKGDVNKAFDQVAQIIKDAAGGDGITSRKNIKDKLKTLDGTEKALVDIFYRFIDYRDAGKGARMTVNDIDKAVAFAKDRMVGKYDLNNNGLSKKEINEMSRTAQLAVRLAAEIKHVRVTDPEPRQDPSPVQIPAELHRAIEEGHTELEWKNGEIIGARVSTNWENNGINAADQLRMLLALPQARNIEKLKLGLADADGMSHYDACLQALADAGPFDKLKDVVIGDFTQDETEISWVSVGDISAIFEAAPNMEKLLVRGSGVEMSNVTHDKLKQLSFESGGLPAGAVSGVNGSTFANLERLSIWFGADEYGANASVSDIDRILTGEGLPSLKHLVLANAEFENAIAQAVATAPIVAQLETLSLAMGTMDDTGAQALLDNAANFTHLQGLNVGDNYISTEMGTRLGDAIGDQVHSTPPKDDDPDYRYVDVSE